MSEVPQSKGDIKGSSAETEGQTPRLEDLQPGDVIRFADITELTAFEDIIAGGVESKHDPELWAARPNLRDLIRPPKFNGTIADIKLTVMADPYERLLDAPKRGWKNGYARGTILGKKHELSSSFAANLIPRYRGFILTADAKSSGRGTIGQIQAELWYFPLTPQSNKAGENYRAVNRFRDDYGDTIKRIVTKPNFEAGRFASADAASRTIGFNQLREAMSRPISTPMRN